MKKKGITSSKDMLKALSSSLKVDDSKNIIEWIEKNNIKTEDGLPITFDDRRFLIDLMNDETPKQAIMASAQVGKTVSMYIKALYMGFKGLNVAFSEPTQDLRDMLTKSKLNRIIEANDLFKHNVKGGLDMKYIKDRMLFLVYTYGNAQVGYTTDLNIYDEVSRSNGETINMLKGRQLNSKYKWEWLISNPNVPNDLLHNFFLSSDQKHWTIKCSHCSKRQILNYDGMYGYNGNVCKEREQFVCQYCDEILNPKDIIMGEWVQRYKNRDISGYWISQLMRPTHSLEEQQALVKEMIYEEKKSAATFYNMFLGLPYSGSTVSVDEYLIKKNVCPRPKEKGIYFMGVDIGSATGHHVIVGDENGVVIEIGKAKDWQEIREYMDKYSVQMCIVDNNPERGPGVDFQQEYLGNVYRNNYVGNKAEELLKTDDATGLIHINRNIVMDNLINALDRGDYKFAYNENDKKLQLFCEQFSTLSKIPALDNQGNATFKWDSPNGWDHYAHAFLYYTSALELFRLRMPQYGIFKAGFDNNKKNYDAFDHFEEEENGSNWLEL